MELTTLTYSSPLVSAARKNPRKMRLIEQGRSRSALMPNQQLTIASKIDYELQLKGRRCANYHPTIWGHEFIESLTTPYTVSLCNIYLHFKCIHGPYSC